MEADQWTLPFFSLFQLPVKLHACMHEVIVRTSRTRTLLRPQVRLLHAAPLFLSSSPNELTSAWTLKVTLEALRSALANLYDLLKVSGVGALPLNPEPGEVEALLNSNSNPGGGGGRPGTDPRLAALTEQVNAIFKEGKAARERAAVVSDVMRSGGAHAGAGDGL